MTGAEQIVAIIDAAQPLPEIPASAASQDDKAARRKPRATASSASSPLPPPADSGDPPARPAAPAPRSAAASLESAPSQTGGSPAKDRRKGAGRAATARRNRHGGGDGRFTPRAAGELDRELAFFPQTDLGNAERFRERNRGRLLWCPAIGWLWWDGKRWARDGADERVKIAEHDTVRAIQDEAEAVTESGQDFVVGSKGRKGDEQDVMFSDTLRAWGRASEQSNRLSPIAKRAAAYLAVAPAELDADPWKLNVGNGTLVFDRGGADGYLRFGPHDPGDLITKLAPVDYDPQADCPLFDAFLGEVQPKTENRRFLMAWMGYSLTADVSEQKLALFYGKGKNGKSVFVETVAHVAGDYSETVPIETFLNEGRGRNAGQATPDLAILPGVRMLRTSEPDRGAKLAEALIKLATGGEPVLARHLNRDYFKFYPAFKLTISGNYRPQILGADDGIWRRVLLVPWAYTVPEDRRDKHLTRKLRAEASGILNRMIDGLLDWLDNGLSVPGDVEDATKEYRRDSDPCGRFLEACVEAAPGERVQSSEMHAVFNAWAKANGASEWSNKGLSNALAERGYRKKQSDVMWWLDVRLLRRVDDFLDEHGKPLRSPGRSDSAGGGGPIGGAEDYEFM